MFLAYVGPEVVLPLTSVLAAITGFLLLFWRHTGGRIVDLIRRWRRKDDVTGAGD